MAQAKQFGAIGDGKHDDTQALQHALDDGDGVLELGRGTFRITAPLKLNLTERGYLGVRGEQGTTRIVVDGPGPALHLVGSHEGTAVPASVKAATYERERLPTITGLEILGLHPEADGIRLEKTMQAVIQGVLLRRCRVGLHLVVRNRNVLLADSHIYDCHDAGVFFDECNLHQVVISGCHISYCKRAGIRQFGGDVHNVQIAGNDIEYNSGQKDVTSGEIVLEAGPTSGVVSEYTIAGNTIQATNDSSGANVLLVGRAADPPVSVHLVAITGNVLGARQRNILVEHGMSVTLAGNTIYDSTVQGVELRGCWNVAVTGNTVGTRLPNRKLPNRDGLLLTDCRGGVVQGNSLFESQAGDKERGGAIALAGSSDVNVSGNQIVDPEFCGIAIVDSERCLVSGNSIADRRNPPVMKTAIEVAGQSRQIINQHNGEWKS